MAMVSAPPERAALRTGGSEQGKGKLAGPGSLEGAVREIAMVPARDGEHAYEVERCCDPYGDPAPSDDEHAQAEQVHDDERDGPQPVDCRRGGIGLHFLNACPGVKPADDGNPGTIVRGLFPRLCIGFGKLTIFG